MSERTAAPQAPLTSPAGAPQADGPVAMFPILGRNDDIAAILRKLDGPEVRLLTLLGTGGVGKTRLATEVMRQARGSFAHGARFVSLAEISDPALVPSALVRGLDLPLTRGTPAEEVVSQVLATRHMLLVLDNLEQLAHGIAPLLSDIIGRCPRLKILATSRVPIRVSGEHRHMVAPLGVHARPEREDDLSGPAVDLFVQRASASRPGYALDAESRALVAEVCQALDGLPLAIELAAARINVLSPQAILARLDNRLGLIAAPQRNVAPRHHSLRAAIAWSYDLLPSPERQLFRRLAVFLAGFGLDAAAQVDDAIGTGADQVATLQRLSALVDHNLLQVHDATDDVPRFIMLETIRAFALESLAAAGEEEIARDAHAMHYMSLVDRDSGALEGRDALQVIPDLDREFANIRAAAAWLALRGRTADAIGMYSSLYSYLLLRGHAHEARDQFEDWLRDPDLDEPARAIAMLRSGCLSNYLGDRARAEPRIAAATAAFRASGDRRHLAVALVLGFPEPANAAEVEQTATDSREGLEIARQVGDWHTAGSALKHLSWVHMIRGQYEEASALSEEWLALARAHGLALHTGNAAMQLGYVRMAQGDLEAAMALTEEAERTFRTFDVALTRHYAMLQLGEIAHTAGDLATARHWLQRSVDAARDAGTTRTLAPSLSTLALVALAEGKLDESLHLTQESLALNARISDDFGIWGCLDLIATIATQASDSDLGAVLLGNADTILARFGADRMPGVETERDMATRAHLVQRLGSTAFQAALERGAALPTEDAIALATSWRLPPGHGAHQDSADLAIRRAGLSNRELEVLRLMCDGFGNADIGRSLGITTRSATAHVTSILTRLDAPNRTTAVAWAIRNQVA